MRIYEQIEVSLSELEQNNLKLSEDSAAEKSRIRRYQCDSLLLLLETVFERKRKNEWLHYITFREPSLQWILIQFPKTGLSCSLSSTVTALESKCEELQRSLEEAERAIKQRKQKRNSVFLEKNPSSESLCLVISLQSQCHTKENL